MKSASSEYKKGKTTKAPKGKKNMKITHEGGAIRAAKIIEIATTPVDLEPPRPEGVDFTYASLTPLVPRVLHGVPRILLEAGMPFFMLQTPSF